PEAIVLAPEGDGLVDLREGLRSLADRGLLDVLVEGGPRLAASVWQAGLVRRGVWYVGANVAGGVGMGAFAAAFPTLEAARRARILEVRRLGGDLRIDWEPEER
ncbi:MAG: RibD family protein, partial [Acidimicrobiia bacterium]